MKFTDVLSAYINKTPIEDASYDKTLLELAIEQSLQTILYTTLQVKEYKKYYISWVVKQEQFFALQNEITELFNKNNIKHTYFKGSVLSKLYDDPSVRTRGDIDLYADKSRFNDVKSILFFNGYKLADFDEDNLHHITFEKNGILVELHYRMFDADVNKSWNELFSDPISKSVLVSDSLYEFTPVNHFLYCMMHYALHLRIGAGLRYILDFFYMFKKTNINLDELHKAIESVKLMRLYNNIINAIRLLFNVDFDSAIEKEDVTFFIEYMLQYGIHGDSNNETEKRTAYHQNKIKYAVSKILLTSKDYRLAKYPKLGKWYFYPICLVVHCCYLLTHKLGSFFKFSFGKNKNKKLYKKLGI